MPRMNAYPPGTFCWLELATSDPEEAKAFYGSLFGWEHHDDPVGEGMIYTMLMKGDQHVGALYGFNEEMKSHDVPPHWLSYVSVADVDATVARARELGGTAPRDPMDVMDLGRMAVIHDPTGAHVALWQPKVVQGAHVVNEPGALTWNELMTPDAKAAAAFYTGLFGWTADAMPMGDASYTVFMSGDRPAAGMMALTPEMGPIPSNWLIYLGTEDCDRLAAGAESGNGNVVVPPTEIPAGRFTILQDPQGALFAGIQATS